MSGETEKDISGWTTDTLHSHLLSLMNERDRRYEQRFASAEQAVHVALAQTETRFENVNEWRGTVSDLLANAMPRPEADSRASSTDEKINALQSRLDRIEGKGLGVNAVWAVLVAVVMITLGVLAFFR